MLQSYEAYYDHGQIQWINDQPEIEKTRIIITLLPPLEKSVETRKLSPLIAGKGEIIRDIIAPACDERDWNVLL